MNEFALASNRTITLPLAEHLVEVRQVVMAEFDQFIVPASTIKATLDELPKENKDYQGIIQVFLNHSAETTQLLTMLTSLDVEQIGELADADPVILAQLVYTLYSLNTAFFDEVKPPRKSADNKNTWWDGFQFLISQGHRHSEIMQYSYGAYLGYVKAADRSHRQNLRTLAGVMRTAHHANKQGMDKFNRELGKD